MKILKVKVHIQVHIQVQSVFFNSWCTYTLNVQTNHLKVLLCKYQLSAKQQTVSVTFRGVS